MILHLVSAVFVKEYDLEVNYLGSYSGLLKRFYP